MYSPTGEEQRRVRFHRRGCFRTFEHFPSPTNPLSPWNVHERAAADAGDRYSHLLPRVPAEEPESHGPRDVDDRSYHLLPRATAEEAEAHDRSAHILPRAPSDESERHDRAAAEAGDPSSFLRLRRDPAEEAEAHDRRDVDAGDRASYLQPRAPAEESETHDHADADADAPSSFRRLRRDPVEEVDAHDRRDTDAGDGSSHLQPRAPAEDSKTRDLADADAGAPSSSLRLRRAPAVDAKADEAGCCRRAKGIVRDTRQTVKPAAASDTGAQRGGRQEKGIGRDAYLPSDLAAEAGEHCSGRRESNDVRDHPPPNAQQSCRNRLPAHDKEVEISSIGLGSQYIDPDHVYELYRQGQLKRLLNYMDSFPGAANDSHYQIIKELIYISMRGDIPTHLEFEWNAKRAESARDLARRIDRSYASLQEDITSAQARICSAEPCHRPFNNMSIHATDSTNANDGQIMQKIPIVSGLLDRHGSLVPNIEGINPVRFYSRHPVWGEHALPVEKSKDKKVGSFFCLYCDKELVGNAADAVNHMRKGCKIPLQTLTNLLEEAEQYKERTEQLRRAKKGSKAIGRNVRIANDVAKIAKLVSELSHSEEFGPLDGTTAVLVMTQSLVMQAWKHLSDDIEPITIAEYCEMASMIALDHLDNISENIIFSATDKETLISTCTAVLSKNINKLALANVAVEAVLEVSDFERREVNLQLIQVKGKIGRRKTVELVHGIVIDNHLSHQQMPKRIEGAKIALLSSEASRMLHDDPQKYVEEMIRKCQDIGATLVICQWSFDEEVSQLLMQGKLTAVGGVSDAELKEIASFTGGHIVQKIQDLSLEKLGEAKLFRETKIGKTKGRVLYIESYASPAPVTIFFHAGNIVLEETMRKLSDALCVLRSLIIDNAFVGGGGSAEISCSLALDAAADTYPGYARPFIKSFAHALDAIPLAAAENTGLLPIDMLTTLKSRHLKEKNAYFGIDCNRHGIYNMKEQRVFASLIGKKKQILLALKVLRIMLKVDDIT